MMAVCASEEQLTVNDMPGYPQFLVYDREAQMTSPMTEENCHTESWYKEDEKEPNFFEKIVNFFKLVNQWWKTLFAVIDQFTD